MSQEKIKLEKFRKPVLICAGILAFYALLGFFVLPAVLEWKLPEIIQEETGRKTSIADIKFNPFALDLSLQGFEIQEKDGQPFVTFGEFYANISVLSTIRHFLLTLDEVRLSKPYVHIEKLKQDKFNFDDLVATEDDEKQEPEEEENGEIFPVRINKLILAEGKLDWEDSHYAEPVQEVIYPIDLKVDNFTTIVEGESDLGFALDLDTGGRMEWTGKLDVNPLSSTGHVKLENIDTHRLWELFLQDKVLFKLTAGEKVAELDYQFSYQNDQLELLLTNGSFDLKNFQLTEKGKDKPVINLADFSIQGIDFNLAEQKVKASSIALSDTSFMTWLTAEGTMNYLSLLGAGATDENATETETQEDHATDDKPALPWIVQVDNIGLKKIVMNFEDQGKNVPVIDIPDFTVQDVGFNSAEQHLKIASVTGKGAKFKAWLNADSVLNYQTIFAAKETRLKEVQVEDVAQAVTDISEAVQQQPETKTKVNAAAGAAPFLVEVGSVDLDGFDVNFEDRTQKKPVVFTLQPLNFKVSGFSTKPGTKLPVLLSAGVNRDGKIKAEGETVLDPLAVELALAVDHITLKAFQPYVEKFVHLDIVDGNLNVDGKLSLAMAADDAFDVKFQGNTSIKKFHTRDTLLNKDFVKWTDLKLKKIDFNLLPIKVTVAEILFKEPYARVAIKEDATMNFNDVIVKQTETKQQPVAASKTKTKTKTKKSAEPYYKIGKFTVVAGSSDFSDRSLFMPFAAEINRLDGTVTGLSSEKNAVAKIDLHGEAFELSPVDIKGEIAPAKGDMDIALDFQSMPLPLVSPYMVDFAGYKIEKGKMSLELKYKVAQGQLTAENNLVIDQLTLGEEVDNPDAVSLPLGLAIALLKDSSGKIEMNLPISGSLEDPEFSVGALVMDAFVNVITKIAMAPFKAIGSLVGSDADLSYVSFAPGSADLDAEQSKKLDDLAKALQEREELSLEIKGRAYQEQDWPEIREQALYDEIKALRAAELQKEGEDIRAEYVELSEDDYKRLLADQFIEKFPHLAEKSIFGNPKLINPDGGDFYEVAKRTMAASIPPEHNRLNQLAKDRAKQIAKYVVERGIPQDRVFVLDTKVVVEGETEAESKELSSELSLRAS
jgi:Domain of Unknown Function (DUF748)